MSKYTVQLRYIIENNYDLGLKDYPIHDESYRPILNQKILNHYKFREIGFETVAMFKHYLNTKMNEIMPYYKKLYESALISFNPLYNQNITETTHTTSEQESTTNGEVTSESETSINSNNGVINIENNTPMGEISLTNINDNTYASKLTKQTTTNSDTSTGSGTTSNESTNNLSAENDYYRTLIGNTENPSEMIKKYRETFLNIDMMIINELNELFFGLY